MLLLKGRDFKLRLPTLKLCLVPGYNPAVATSPGESCDVKASEPLAQAHQRRLIVTCLMHGQSLANGVCYF